jgi:acetamidase/formamidase/AraC-like DNA-binding protein
LRFTTNAYPKEQRRDAWRFALQRQAIDLKDMADEGLYGELVTSRSELGIDFTRLTATRQSLSLDFSQAPDLFWLNMLLDGEAEVRHGTSTINAQDGDILYGLGSAPALHSFSGDNRCLIIKIPRPVLAHRLRTPLPENVSKLSGDTGASRVLAGMLRSVADVLAEATTDHLRPVELGLPEFLLASLLDNAPPRSLGGAAGMRAVLLERIFQTIEMRLSDPELNLQQVASEHGISPRYLQKLFESVDESFGHFVKLRRLERCRLDLRSPLHAQKSISDILFQWGFNDSASFSRAFREQYGVSPREYRKGAPADTERQELLHRGSPTGRRDARVVPDIVIDAPEIGKGAVGEAGDEPVLSGVRHHSLPVSPETIHWGFFSRNLKPVLEVRSGDYVTIETLTHHANDDAERMIDGDPGAESVYRWTAESKAVERRGAGPLEASAYGRGAGEGFGVHICTGPIAIAGAQPGDVVEVKILELTPRPSGNEKFLGRTFGSNNAAYWGFHYADLLTEPRPREVITIYEVEGGNGNGRACAHAVYNYRWTPQTDPFGVVHTRIDYPGVPVDHTTIEKNFDVLADVEIPVRPHFGVIGLAPAHAGLIDSVPPAAFGGNLDNWRTGPGSRIFLPVAVPGGLLSLGDPHASQGDSELCGTAIECSMTALIQIIHHPAQAMHGNLRDLDYPLIETEDEWVIMGFSLPDYLKELGDDAQSEIYKRSSIDGAMRDAFRKARRFLMTAKGLTEDEAISLLSVGVDFGVTQVVNGNWGVHAVIRKALFTN